MMLPRGTIYQTDPDGRGVVGVSVAQGTRTVWLDAADYDAVVREVGEASWFLGHNERGTAYVRVRNPDTGLKEAVARIITGRVRCTSVGYADGDRLNLRRKNLLIGCGCGGRPKRRRHLGRGVTDVNPSIT